MALAACVAILAGCGQISFGSARGVADAGEAADLGTVDPDAATPDTGENPEDAGPAPDAGCLPVPTPPPPSDWPFDSGKDAYLAHFWETSPKRGADPVCSTCHADAMRGWKPLMPRASELEAPGKFPRAVDELWGLVVMGGASRPTRLQSAHAEGGEYVREYRYTPDDGIWLDAFVALSFECRWVGTYAARPDGGGACEEPPDAGVASSDAGVADDGGPDDAAADAGADDAGPGDLGPDAGPLDVGSADAGVTDAGSVGPAPVCECALEVRDLSHCRP